MCLFKKNLNYFNHYFSVYLTSHFKFSDRVSVPERRDGALLVAMGIEWGGVRVEGKRMRNSLFPLFSPVCCRCGGSYHSNDERVCVNDVLGVV